MERRGKGRTLLLSLIHVLNLNQNHQNLTPVVIRAARVGRVGRVARVARVRVKEVLCRIDIRLSPDHDAYYQGITRRRSLVING